MPDLVFVFVTVAVGLAAGGFAAPPSGGADLGAVGFAVGVEPCFLPAAAGEAVGFCADAGFADATRADAAPGFAAGLTVLCADGFCADAGFCGSGLSVDAVAFIDERGYAVFLGAMETLIVGAETALRGARGLYSPLIMLCTS